jgi:lauroyl/myristoyl acyltransferase
MPRWARLVASVLAVLVGDVLRVRRSHVESSMRRAGIPEPARMARAMYRSLASAVAELLASRFGHEPRFQGSLDAIPGLVASGRGAVVATAHTGGFDVAACAVAALTPLTVVSKRLHVGLADRIWQSTRRARGLRIVHAGDAARAAFDALGRGELVAMLVDQAPGRRRGAVELPFLGARAWVDLAPALVAMRARVPLVAAFPLRLAGGEHTVTIVRVLEPPQRPALSWAREAMGEVTRALEETVHAHPEQWLWMHRRWKDVAPLPGRRSSLAGVPLPG